MASGKTHKPSEEEETVQELIRALVDVENDYEPATLADILNWLEIQLPGCDAMPLAIKALAVLIEKGDLSGHRNAIDPMNYTWTLSSRM